MAQAKESKKDRPAHRVLLYVQTAEDVSILQDILVGIGAEGVVCTDLADLCWRTAQDVDAVLLTEQSIVDGALPVLAEALESQPEWSDLPVLFVAAGGAESPLAVQAMQELRNVVILDRPVRIATLAGVLRMASRVRDKQRQVRDLLEERQRREQNLHELKDRAEGLAWVNEWLARFPRENPDPVLRVSADSVVLYHNTGAEGLCRWWGCHDGQRVPPDMQEIISAALASNKVMQHEVSFDSRTYWQTISPFVADGYVNIYGQDITAREQAEANQALLTDILRVLNRGGDLHPLIAEILRLIREAAGFDAVGLRLRQGEDCPYFEANGFSQEFLREENFLCTRAGDGAVIRDAAGRPMLECTCGLVLSGRTDPNMSCFTRDGSFWTNTASELLALAPEADPPDRSA
jgi:hypothetical protein